MAEFNFIESKIAFIRDFMNSPRPSSELDDFIRAFDTCNIHTIVMDDIPVEQVDPSDDVQIVNTDATEPVVNPTRRVRRGKKPLIHNAKTAGVHPRAKMVKVTFMDRISYYGSITAAAQALHCTHNQIMYALKHHKTINGQEVAYQDPDTLFKN